MTERIRCDLFTRSYALIQKALLRQITCQSKSLAKMFARELTPVASELKFAERGDAKKGNQLRAPGR